MHPTTRAFWASAKRPHLLAAFVFVLLILPPLVRAQVYNRPTYSSPIAISANDHLIWVVNPSDDSVSVIRPDTNTRLDKITVGDEPQSVALTPNGQYAFVANAAGNSVTVIQIQDSAWGTFNAHVDTSAGVNGHLTTGAEPWNIVTSPDGLRVFVANSAQDTITVIDAVARSVIGHVDLRNSLANDPDRSRPFQPRGLAVTLDNTKLYVTRFLSFTKSGGRQGDDLGKEGLVAVLNINTASANINDYSVARVVALAPQITGFKFPGLTNPPAPDTFAFPNQLQSIVLRGDRAYLPNIAASPSGPLRFNLDTHAFVNMIGGVTGTSPVDLGTTNLHLGARDPEPGKRREFFANPWAMAFTTQSGAGNAYVVSAASDLLVKLNVDGSGNLAFTLDGDTTRYIDLNDPTIPNTSGTNAGKSPQGIAINSTGTVAYVANFVSRNVSVVDLTTDGVIATVQTSDLPTPGSQGETNLVGAEMFFSSRGNFDTIPGTNSLRDRLSSEGWQSCASCHFKGLTDGVIWQFAAGPRKSVPLNSSFNPQNRSQQRVLNYSAIFDEVEDFEANVRNVSGPGALAGGALDPNHGLLIGDTGDLNVAPSAVNAFALASANRPQVTVTLPGSPNKVPALTAMREWVRFAVRTPNAPVPGLPNAPSPADLTAGRSLFAQANCSRCHGGQNWSVSLKDFSSPPSSAEGFTTTERTGSFTGNPVATQYLNRFLRDIGSFNLGVPGQGNLLGNNIGADEKAAAAVVNGALQPAQDALGRDYNNDARGIGFNVPSLLGLHVLPPFMHNGAAESLAAVVGDVKHRTDNGRLPDRLSNAADQAKVVAFLETIDATTAPVFDVGDRPTYSSPIAINPTDRLIWVVNPSDDSVSVIRPDSNTRLAKITVGDEPQSIALTPDNQYAYVANAAGNSVTVIYISDPAWGTFNAYVDTSAGVNGHITTGAEPWNIVCSPDGKRVFVANSQQDTITVINTATRGILGHVLLRPDPFANHFQPRGLAVTADNSKLYVTRFLSFAKSGGRQGDDLGRQGMVDVLDINTGSTSIADYKLARSLALAPQITGFKFPGLTNPPAPDTFAFPNQLQSVVIRGETAYLPNIAASPTGPLRFNLDTHAFVNMIAGANSTSPVDLGALNLHLGARDPEPGKVRLFFANPWAIAFTSQMGDGFGYAVSAASDLLVKVRVLPDGRLDFTGDGDTTRFIDLNDPSNAATSGTNAAKNPQGITINSVGTRAYVANFVSRNVTVVDLTNDTVIATVPTSDLPAPGSQGETNLVGAEMFFSSRGHFDAIPGTNSLRDRLSSEGWQSCASCHFKGLTDGVIWQFNAGPRKSVPLNATFSPHNRNQQRVLNYSAIFDEVEDFEANIRNVSGPGALAVPINGNTLDPNHGLLIGDSGDLNVAPSAINAFTLPNVNRPQVTVTLPGSPNKIPALTAMREWVRFAVRTPNTQLPGFPGAHPPDFISGGRTLFFSAGCVQCHGGLNWTVSVKDFNSPPISAEIFMERVPTPFTGNPVGAQYLNRFLRDIGSFNLGVPGQGNNLGNNVGADEKAAPAVSLGALQAAQDALGIDYNSDGKGIGFNVPSLLGISTVPPFMHNGAAENLLTVISDVKHRTDNGRRPDLLSNPSDQIKVFAFLETIDTKTVPFVPLDVRPSGSQIILGFDSISGVQYGIALRSSITSIPTVVSNVNGTGQRVEVAFPIVGGARFYQLVPAP